MDESNNNSNSTTPAFIIAVIICAIIFIMILNEFFPDYSFGEKAGVFIVSGIICAIIFGIAAGLVNAIYKIIVEITIAFLLLLNVTYVAYCWSVKEEIIEDLFVEGIISDTDSVLIPGLILLLLLFIFNLLAVITLLPFARIAKSDILDI